MNIPERPLTFRERMGFAQVPEQLRSDELNQEIRAKLWAVFYSFFDDESYHGWLSGDSRRFAQQWHVEGEHKPLDEFNAELNRFSNSLKQRFFDADFYPLFDLLEFALRSSIFPRDRKRLIGVILEEGRAGWRAVGAQVVPFASQEEADTIAAGLAELERSASAGVRSHLKKSAAALSNGGWADSVRESVSAAEAAARSFDEKITLGQIPKTLRAQGKPIHPALAQSLSALYGYASDEKGIRHSLVDEADAAVGEDEALLVYGLSVSFALFLVRLKTKT